MILLARRLDRYVMSRFVGALSIALLALTVIFVLIHIMDHVDVYLDHDAPWSAVGRYYLFEMPYNTLLTLPMAVLIATIISIGELGRHGELTAMKASGLSLYRIALPLIVFGLGLTLAVLFLGETIVPRLNEQGNEVYEEEILDQPKDFEDFRGNFVYQNPEGYTYLVRSLFVNDSGGASADQVEIQREMEDGTFLRINAPQMTWEGERGLWALRDGELRVFPGEAASDSAAADSAASRPVAGSAVAAAAPATAVAAPATAPAADSSAAPPPRPIDERMFTFALLRSAAISDTPQELIVEDKDPEEMGYEDLVRYIDDRERLGADTRQEQVDLHMKVAYPFANFVILIFGIALVGSASHAGRQSATVGFGLALFLTIIFWGFLRVGQGIGYGGALPPFAAAWLANGIFGVVGLVLLARART
ncbi:MAG TPA: LptF/LptG family permease [Gemmatimonadota bacterium]|jgi:lipopolysaccharide export system permease protein